MSPAPVIAGEIGANPLPCGRTILAPVFGPRPTRRRESHPPVRHQCHPPGPGSEPLHLSIHHKCGQFAESHRGSPRQDSFCLLAIPTELDFGRALEAFVVFQMADVV